jgi:uncharacterized membrane protein YfcA
MVYVFSALIALGALFTRGFSGFGSALVLMPLLMLFLDVRTAVVAAALTQVPVGFTLAFRSQSDFDRSYVKLLLLPGILGILVGSFALAKVEAELLKRVFGAMTVIFALRIVLALRRNVTAYRKWPASVGFVAGALGGVLGGIFGTGGPPVIVYLEHQILNKDVLRATFLTYFLVTDSLRLASYGLSGLITRRAVMIGLAMIPAALIGAYLGTRLSARVDERTFRIAVGALLFVTGVLLAVGR